MQHLNACFLSLTKHAFPTPLDSDLLPLSKMHQPCMIALIRYAFITYRNFRPLANNSWFNTGTAENGAMALANLKFATSVRQLLLHKDSAIRLLQLNQIRISDLWEMHNTTRSTISWCRVQSDECMVNKVLLVVNHDALPCNSSCQRKCVSSLLYYPPFYEEASRAG